MSCCLNRQSKRHLSTVLWRNKLMVRRSKVAMCCFWFAPLFFFGIAMIMMGNYQGTTTQIKTMDPYVVSSSSFSDEGA